MAMVKLYREIPKADIDKGKSVLTQEQAFMKLQAEGEIGSNVHALADQNGKLVMVWHD